MMKKTNREALKAKLAADNVQAESESAGVARPNTHMIIAKKDIIMPADTEN